MLKGDPDTTKNSLRIRLSLFLPFVSRDASDVGEQRCGRNLSWLTSINSLTLKCTFW